MKRNAILTVSTLVLGLLACAFSLQAQQPPDAGLAMKIAQARKANSTLMHQYMWNTRTEFIMNGETKDVRIDQEMYGPGGTLQKTELNNESSGHPHGFLRRRIADHEKDQLEKYFKSLRSILDQYTLPTAGKMVDFLGSAKVQFVQDASGAPLLLVQGNNVVQPGDSLSVWVDPTSYAFKRIQIITADDDGNPVNVNGTYKTIPPGLTFISLAEVDLPAKSITIQIHNYDYVPVD